MPPKQRITKQDILDAALEIIRQEGSEKLNVRKIAAYLNCSTQPVLYGFHSIEEIRNEVYKQIDAYHTAFIMPKQTEDPLLELGLNYVRFAYTEQHFFRFLFQSDKFSGMNIDRLLKDPQTAPLITLVEKTMGLDRDEAKEAFMTFFITVHGMASLLANNSLVYEEERLKKILFNVYEGVRKC